MGVLLPNYYIRKNSLSQVICPAFCLCLTIGAFIKREYAFFAVADEQDKAIYVIKSRF